MKCMYWLNYEIVICSQRKASKCLLNFNLNQINLVYKTTIPAKHKKANYEWKQKIMHASKWKKKLLELLKEIMKIIKHYKIHYKR